MTNPTGEVRRTSAFDEALDVLGDFLRGVPGVSLRDARRANAVVREWVRSRAAQTARMRAAFGCKPLASKAEFTGRK